MSDGTASPSGRIVQTKSLSLERTLGFACDRVWVFMLFYSIVPYLMSADIRSSLYMNMFVSLSSATIMLIFIGIVARRDEVMRQNHLIIILAAAAMTVGTIVGFFINLSDTVGILALGGCALATGLGSAALFVCWLELFSDVERESIIELTLGVLLAFAIGLVLNATPSIFADIVVAAMPAVSGVLLWHSSRTVEHPVDNILPGQVPKHISLLLLKGTIGVVSFGLIAGFFDVFTGYRSFEVADEYGIFLFIGGMVMMACVLAICVKPRHDNLSWVYRIAIFVFCAGCLSTLFLRDRSSFAGYLIFAGYLAFSVVLFAACVKLNKTFGLGITKLLALSYAAVYGGEVVGELLANAIGANPAQDMLPLITLISVLWLFFVHLFFFNDFFHIAPAQPNAEQTAQKTEIHRHRSPSSKRVCAIIAKRYGLTPREGEVLPMLIQGRTISRIEETLFISQGTVSTHIRHIYKKTGAENRQALIDLAEKIANEE